jgi:phage virion morphogenesis protein
VTVAVEAHIEGLAALGAGLARMVALGERPRPIWDAIGQYGESSTRLRFKKQTDPEGARWKPSIRARESGGTTLQLKGAYGGLLGSITHNSTNSGTAWGTNKKYAGIHQFGGTIKAKGKNLRFQIGGRFVSVKAVTIPKRSFVGVNADDVSEMLAVANDAVDLAARNRGPA